MQRDQFVESHQAPALCLQVFGEARERLVPRHRRRGHHLIHLIDAGHVRLQWLGKLERNQQMLPLLCSAAVLGALLQWRTERYRASPRKGGMALTQNPCDISHAHTSINQCAVPCQPGSVGGCGSGRPRHGLMPTRVNPYCRFGQSGLESDCASAPGCHDAIMSNSSRNRFIF